MTPPEAIAMLDLSCASTGRKAANLIGKSGVSFFSDLTSLLHRDGLYMVFVFLESVAAKKKHPQEAAPYRDLQKLFFSVLKKHLPGVGLNGENCAPLELCDAFRGRLEDLIQ